MILDIRTYRWHVDQTGDNWMAALYTNGWELWIEGYHVSYACSLPWGMGRGRRETTPTHQKLHRPS